MAKHFFSRRVRERQLYPHVIASTVAGDEATLFVEATTNNQDTVVKVYVYWYIPQKGEPVLMIEVDDEDLPEGNDNMDIRIRLRRNDGLVYEANQEETKYLKEVD